MLLGHYSSIIFCDFVWHGVRRNRIKTPAPAGRNENLTGEIGGYILMSLLAIVANALRFGVENILTNIEAKNRSGTNFRFLIK